MEAVASAAAASRSVSLSMSSSPLPSRKEWRAVTEQSVPGLGNEEMERSKMGQSDERTIYEQGRESLDVPDFVSVQIDGVVGVHDGDYEQKLLSYAKKRQELLQMEIDLRARMIARSQIMEMRNSFDAQIKDHASFAAKLQDQIHEREQRIADLERLMEEKDRELHAIKLDNEAAWAKEGLLREQNKELANFRRERDTVEAERAHHMKQLHDLQEHIQEKDRQLMELQEQHRNAQETILYKDDQLKEAQNWINHAQEMDALQSNAHLTLQTQLRERTEQCNQLWMGFQRQFAEMERLHMQTIQQLQLELAGTRGKHECHNVESHISQSDSEKVPHSVQNNANHIEANGNEGSGRNSGSISNGNVDSAQSFVSSGDVAVANLAPGHPINLQSLLGVPSYLQHSHLTMHPFVVHQQGVNHAVPSHGSQAQLGYIPSAMSSLPHWPGSHGVSEGDSQNHYTHSQADTTPARSDSIHGYAISENEPLLHSAYLSAHISNGREVDSVVLSSTDELQALESTEKQCLTGQDQPIVQQVSSQLDETLRLSPYEQTSQDNSGISLTTDGFETQISVTESSGSVASPASGTPNNLINFSESTLNNAPDAIALEAQGSAGQTYSLSHGKISEAALLDERSLLACIVRTIPAGGRIHISSTLPNRLGKMLAPLHWHDYRKKYGKLDDFVANHPELFLTEGDYIMLREGAQGIIAATAAVAKVAAAAAATSSRSSFFPSVALTPIAQPTNRLRKAPSTESTRAGNAVDGSLSSSIQSQSNPSYTNIKILSKSKDALEMNGRIGQTSVFSLTENGPSNCRSKGHSNAIVADLYNDGRQSRAAATSMMPRR